LAQYGEVIQNVGWTHLSCNTKVFLSLLKSQQCEILFYLEEWRSLQTPQHCSFDCGASWCFYSSGIMDG